MRGVPAARPGPRPDAPTVGSGRVVVSGRAAPLRTCVGCRARAPRSQLLRVVAVEVDGRSSVVPDHRGRLPGRGASVHPVPACLDLAERRRAFPRALRLAGPLDTSALRAWVEQQANDGGPRGTGAPPDIASRKQAEKPDEHSMSTQL